LTDPVSIEQGIGPVCLAKMQVESGLSRNTDQARQSDYDYHITRGSDAVLVITDLDKGGMSATNNMEAILSNIAAEQGTTVSQLTLPIVYRDSEGNYDGVTVGPGGVNFYPLTKGRPITKQRDAVMAALQGQKN